MAHNEKLVDKTINYFRADFREKTPHSLGYYLCSAHKKLPTVDQRTFLLGDEELKGCHNKTPTENACYAHVTLTTPGEPATIVPDARNANEANLEEMAARPQTNFMDGDLWFYCKKNHLFFSSTQLPLNRATDYIHQILELAGEPDAAHEFTMTRVANVDKLRLIQQGVSSITLGASLYEASGHYMERQTLRKRLFGGLSSEVFDMLKKDKRFQDHAQAENVSAEIVLKFDRRRLYGSQGQLAMQSLAKRVIEDGERNGFTIVTYNNEKVTADDIVLRTSKKIKKMGKTVFHEDVWTAMREYYLELKKNGLLVQ